VLVAAAVLAKSVHDDNATAGLAGRQHVVDHVQAGAIGRADLVAAERHQLRRGLRF
jgi:hypothetical protein